MPSGRMSSCCAWASGSQRLRALHPPSYPTLALRDMADERIPDGSRGESPCGRGSRRYTFKLTTIRQPQRTTGGLVFVSPEGTNGPRSDSGPHKNQVVTSSTGNN